MSIEAPKMQDLKPVLVPLATDSRLGMKKTEEKMKTTTVGAAVDGVEDVKPKQKEAKEKVLLAHEEPEHKQHRLTIDKLAADAPRPNVAGPLPLLHQAGIGDNYNGAAASSAGTGEYGFCL